MKVLMINYEFPPIGGGGGNVTYFISKNLALRGHEVKIVTSRFRNLPKREKKDEFEIIRVPVLRKNPNYCRFHEMLTFVVSASVYCLWFVRKFNPDIVHVFFGIPSGPVAYLLKKIYNLPYVLFLGGRDVPRIHPDPPIYRLLYGILMPAIKGIWGNSKAVVACSQGLRELALKTGINVNIRVIPDGVDLKRFSPPDRSMVPKTIKILAVGRLIPRKGFDCLIKSIPIALKLTKGDFCVEIVGDGPLWNELRQLSKQEGVDKKVIFSGSIPYEELHKKYREADVFVLTSKAEGMPLVVLEAMACGLPIISTNVQGVDELVLPGVNGFLFQPSDHNALGRHIASIVSDHRMRIEMGKQSLKIIKRFDWANITERYIDIYSS